MLTGDVAQNQDVDVVSVSTESKNSNAYHVDQIVIHRDANDETAMTLDVVMMRGYMNGTTFVGVEKIDVHLTLPEIVDFMTAAVVAGNTLEEDFKEKLWACLQAGNHVPAGTVS